MSYVDDEYGRMVAAFEPVPQPVDDRAVLRHRLLLLALVCIAALALVALAKVGPSDVRIAGASTGDGCYGWADEVERAFGPQHVGTVCSLIACESGGNPNAVSRTSDHGLLQLNKVWNQPNHPDPVAQFIGRHWHVVYDGWSNLVMAQKVAHHYGFEMWSCYR